MPGKLIIEAEFCMLKVMLVAVATSPLENPEGDNCRRIAAFDISFGPNIGLFPASMKLERRQTGYQSRLARKPCVLGLFQDARSAVLEPSNSKIGSSTRGHQEWLCTARFAWIFGVAKHPTKHPVRCAPRYLPVSFEVCANHLSVPGIGWQHRGLRMHV